MQVGEFVKRRKKGKKKEERMESGKHVLFVVWQSTVSRDNLEPREKVN